MSFSQLHKETLSLLITLKEATFHPSNTTWHWIFQAPSHFNNHTLQTPSNLSWPHPILCNLKEPINKTSNLIPHSYSMLKSRSYIYILFFLFPSSTSLPLSLFTCSIFNRLVTLHLSIQILGTTLSPIVLLFFP